MLQGLKDRTIALARSPHAEKALFAISFAESSFFPLPPDLLLGPMAAAQPTKWLRFASSAWSLRCWAACSATRSVCS